MMLLRRTLILIVDCRLSIAGTQTAFAYTGVKLPQTRKSAIGNQQSAIVYLLGGKK